MIEPIETAGFGVVVYDYPYNRNLEESCARFARDMSAFRRQAGETRPWCWWDIHGGLWSFGTMSKARPTVATSRRSF